MPLVDPALKSQFPDALVGGLLPTLGYVWDPILLQYVVATPSVGGGGGGAVTIINGADVAEGATTDLEAAAGNGSVIAILKRIRTLLSNPLAVTGAFFQVTQPVSIAAAVPVTDNAGSLTVDSAQLPAALVGARLDVNVGASISLPGTVVDGGDVAQGAKADAVWDGVTVSTTISAVMKYIGQKVEAVRALLAGTLLVTQKTNQARVWKSIRFTSAAAPIADTLCSGILNTDGVDAGAGATTFAVTAGKRFRVTSIALSLRTTTAATPWGLLSLRVNPGGVAVLASPIVHWLGVGGTAAVIGNVAADTLIFPEGWEFAGAMQLALSFANNVATNVVNIVVHGYEYTP